MKVFITGGTTGIGQELAKTYLSKGWDVGVCGRNLAKLPEELKSTLQTFEVDVCNRDALLAAVEEFAKGGLNLMICNAGVATPDKTAIPDWEVGRKLLEINILGLWDSVAAGVSQMKHKNRKQIVLIGSLAGYIGLPGAASYSGSKSFVQTIGQSLAIDLKKEGIDVTTINPGFIKTPLTAQNDHPMPFLMELEDAGKKIYRAIEKKRLTYAFPFPLAQAVAFLSLLSQKYYIRLMRLFGKKLLGRKT